MSAPTNHWKLGLFVVGSTIVALATVVFIGSYGLQAESVEYRSYFDEAVTGLDIGSPVKFRGVTIGKVSAVSIAADHRHVAITYALDVESLGHLGLAQPRGPKTKMMIPADLRVQLGSTGITGVKYVLLDYFDVRDEPLPKLPFPVPDNYIPATPSTMKNVEDSVVKTVDRFPEVADQLLTMLTTINRMLLEIEAQKVPHKAAAVLDDAQSMLHVLHGKLEQIPVDKLAGEAHVTIQNVNSAAQRMDAMLARLDGRDGLLSSMQRATNSIGDVAGDARDYGGDLATTLRDVSEAADAIRRLATTLESDSDMLLKGRAAVAR